MIEKFMTILQWVSDHINDILLIVGNMITIGSAIYHWWQKIRAERVTKAVVAGMEKYANSPPAPNSDIRTTVTKAADGLGCRLDLDRFVRSLK